MRLELVGGPEDGLMVEVGQMEPHHCRLAPTQPNFEYVTTEPTEDVLAPMVDHYSLRRWRSGSGEFSLCYNYTGRWRE